MTAAHPPLPAWVVSQLQARALCARGCGRNAQGEVTWAGSGKTELLCNPCWDAGAVA